MVKFALVPDILPGFGLGRVTLPPQALAGGVPAPANSQAKVIDPVKVASLL